MCRDAWASAKIFEALEDYTPPPGGLPGIDILEKPETIVETVRVQVKLDPWHGVKRIMDEVPKLHSAYIFVLRGLIAAIFHWNPEGMHSFVEILGKAYLRKLVDRAEVERWLRESGSKHTWYTLDFDWKKARVRRYIPEPRILEQSILAWLELVQQGNYADATHTSPITNKVLAEVNKLLEHVRKGCLSDPEGVNLYHRKGTCKVTLF